MSFLKDRWSAVLDEGAQLHDQFLNLREHLDVRLEHLLAKPGPTRALFGFLRNHHPIFTAPGLAVVSKYDDVVEVLGQDEFFGVTEIYLKKMQMTTGDFVLGLANTPQYQREIGLMRQSIHHEDMQTIHHLVTQAATQLVEAAAPDGRIDVVGGLSRVVPNRLVGEYFGSPGPDAATNMGWMRAIFREIFLNLGNDPKMEEAAETASQALNDYLNNLIAARKAALAASQSLPDDFLCRLVELQPGAQPPLEDETIRRIIGGTIVGTVDTNSQAIAQAIDQLLDRPPELQAAQAAAQADDDDLFARYIFEALRFNPQNPLLLRHCEQSYTLAASTDRATLIPQGSLVIVGTESAMFDPDRFPAPETFRIDRPMADYIHFGFGLHTCFGKHIAQLLIPAVAKQLLRRKGLRRAGGEDGQLRYDGAFPDRLIVEFDVE